MDFSKPHCIEKVFSCQLKIQSIWLHDLHKSNKETLLRIRIFFCAGQHKVCVLHKCSWQLFRRADFTYNYEFRPKYWACELIASTGSINFLAHPFLDLRLNFNKWAQETNQQCLNWGLVAPGTSENRVQLSHKLRPPHGGMVALNAARSLLFGLKLQFPPQPLISF